MIAQIIIYGFSSVTIDLLSPNTPCYHDTSLTYYKDIDRNNLLCKNSLLSNREWNIIKGDRFDIWR